jgi:Helix-turn-helix domain
MSYTVTKFVLDLAGLTPSEKAVAHSLAYHAHADGAESYPSMNTIATEAGLSDRRAAQRVVRRLERKGLIVAETSKSGGRYKATHYRFDLGYSGPTVALYQTVTATPVARNSDPSCTKQRSYGRPKGYERSLKGHTGADRAVPSCVWDDPDPFWHSDEAEKLDPHGCIRQQLWEEEQIIQSIPPALTHWTANLHPLLPRVPLSETDAAKAFHGVSEQLVNGAAKLFGTARGSTQPYWTTPTSSPSTKCTALALRRHWLARSGTVASATTIPPSQSRSAFSSGAT